MSGCILYTAFVVEKIFSSNMRLTKLFKHNRINDEIVVSIKNKFKSLFGEMLKGKELRISDVECKVTVRGIGNE